VTARTDAELVLAAREGDQAAFAAIDDRYADRAHGFFCCSIQRDRDEGQTARASGRCLAPALP